MPVSFEAVEARQQLLQRAVDSERGAALVAHESTGFGLDPRWSEVLPGEAVKLIRRRRKRE